MGKKKKGGGAKLSAKQHTIAAASNVADTNEPEQPSDEPCATPSQQSQDVPTTPATDCHESKELNMASDGAQNKAQGDETSASEALEASSQDCDSDTFADGVVGGPLLLKEENRAEEERMPPKTASDQEHPTVSNSQEEGCPRQDVHIIENPTPVLVAPPRFVDEDVSVAASDVVIGEKDAAADGSKDAVTTGRMSWLWKGLSRTTDDESDNQPAPPRIDYEPEFQTLSQRLEELERTRKGLQALSESVRKIEERPTSTTSANTAVPLASKQDSGSVQPPASTSGVFSTFVQAARDSVSNVRSKLGAAVQVAIAERAARDAEFAAQAAVSCEKETQALAKSASKRVTAETAKKRAEAARVMAQCARDNAMAATSAERRAQEALAEAGTGDYAVAASRHAESASLHAAAAAAAADSAVAAAADGFSIANMRASWEEASALTKEASNAAAKAWRAEAATRKAAEKVWLAQARAKMNKDVRAAEQSAGEANGAVSEAACLVQALSAMSQRFPTLEAQAARSLLDAKASATNATLELQRAQQVATEKLEEEADAIVAAPHAAEAQRLARDAQSATKIVASALAAAETTVSGAETANNTAGWSSAAKSVEKALINATAAQTAARLAADQCVASAEAASKQAHNKWAGSELMPDASACAERAVASALQAEADKAALQDIEENCRSKAEEWHADDQRLATGNSKLTVAHKTALAAVLAGRDTCCFKEQTTGQTADISKGASLSIAKGRLAIAAEAATKAKAAAGVAAERAEETRIVCEQIAELGVGSRSDRVARMICQANEEWTNASTAAFNAQMDADVAKQASDVAAEALSTLEDSQSKEDRDWMETQERISALVRIAESNLEDISSACSRATLAASACNPGDGHQYISADSMAEQATLAAHAVADAEISAKAISRSASEATLIAKCTQKRYLQEAVKLADMAVRVSNRAEQLLATTVARQKLAANAATRAAIFRTKLVEVRQGCVLAVSQKVQEALVAAQGAECALNDAETAWGHAVALARAGQIEETNLSVRQAEEAAQLATKRAAEACAAAYAAKSSGQHADDGTWEEWQMAVDQAKDAATMACEHRQGAKKAAAGARAAAVQAAAVDREMRCKLKGSSFLTKGQAQGSTPSIAKRQGNAGVGMHLQFLPRQGHAIEGFVSGKPAQASGRLFVGDVLVAVDGVDVRYRSACRDLLCGPTHSSVTLTVRHCTRPGAPTELDSVDDVVLQRQEW